jgi:hypothetical protein
VSEGDYGEGIWLMDFTYLDEIEQRNLFVGQGERRQGERMRIVTMSALLYNEYILVKTVYCVTLEEFIKEKINSFSLPISTKICSSTK